jgi:hypothetical protein
VAERFLVKRRGVQRVEQLVDVLDPDIDGCQLSDRGRGAAHRIAPDLVEPDGSVQGVGAAQ